MSATTIKIEDPLLSELKKNLHKRSLSAFVRGVLEQEIQRQKMGEAAQRYMEFLEAHPTERAWLVEWEKSDLASPLRASKRKST